MKNLNQLYNQLYTKHKSTRFLIIKWNIIFLKQII